MKKIIFMFLAIGVGNVSAQGLTHNITIINGSPESVTVTVDYSSMWDRMDLNRTKTVPAYSATTVKTRHDRCTDPRGILSLLISGSDTPQAQARVEIWNDAEQHKINQNIHKVDVIEDFTDYKSVQPIFLGFDVIKRPDLMKIDASLNWAKVGTKCHAEVNSVINVQDLLPGGNWTSYCENVDKNNSVITAKCKDYFGVEHLLSYNLVSSKCSNYALDYDGAINKLVCATNKKGIPVGNWKKTCRPDKADKNFIPTVSGSIFYAWCYYETCVKSECSDQVGLINYDIKRCISNSLSYDKKHGEFICDDDKLLPKGTWRNYCNDGEHIPYISNKDWGIETLNAFCSADHNKWSWVKYVDLPDCKSGFLSYDLSSNSLKCDAKTKYAPKRTNSNNRIGSQVAKFW